MALSVGVISVDEIMKSMFPAVTSSAVGKRLEAAMFRKWLISLTGE